MKTACEEAAKRYGNHDWDCRLRLRCEDCTCGFAAAIKAAQPSAISDGVSVPREPTDAMLQAIWGRPLTANDTGARKIARAKYADMLAAAQEGK